ncbi:MAG: metallophosphoesterase [Candidatus Brocadiia bacterium]
MRVFALGDLHLSAAADKPMDVFGPAWRDHQGQIEANWRGTVGSDDLVLLCGDLSWAMKLEEALPDLEFIESLPGVKYLIRGNHDYWFSRPGRVREALGPTTHLIRFDAAVHRGVGICGVRGWLLPTHPDYAAQTDGKHWRRARLRLEMSLKALRSLDWEVAVAMFHYPPLGDAERTLVEMVGEAGVRHCVYGHLHGQDAADAFEGEVEGVRIRCVSADKVDFRPLLLFEHPE